MNECMTLADHIVDLNTIGRIFLIGLLDAAAILTGYWLIIRVSMGQAEANEKHIKDLRETIHVLRGMNGND